MSSSRRGSSTVTDTLTSEVVTTSTGVLNRSNTSNSRRRNPCAISMRVDVMSMTVTPRLQASAVRPSCARPSAVISVPGDFRPPRVEDPDRDVLRDRRQDRARVQHLRAEVRQLGRLGERQLRHQARRLGTTRGIGGQHPVDVGPDLNLVDIEAGAEDGGRVVRSAAAERGRHAVGGRADESAQHRHLAGGSAARRRRSRVRLQVASMSGIAAVCSASVTRTARESTQAVCMPVDRRMPRPRCGCWRARPSRRSRRARAATPRGGAASVRTVSISAENSADSCAIRPAEPFVPRRAIRDARVPLEQVVQEARRARRRRRQRPAAPIRSDGR